jgi:hypothetical protein
MNIPVTKLSLGDPRGLSEKIGELLAGLKAKCDVVTWLGFYRKEDMLGFFSCVLPPNITGLSRHTLVSGKLVIDTANAERPTLRVVFLAKPGPTQRLTFEKLLGEAVKSEVWDFIRR